MKAARLVSLLLLVTPAWCGTKILMHNVSSPVSGYRYATKTQGQGTVASVTNSVKGPTSGVQLSATAGGPTLVWISPPVATATTISGTVTMNIWASEQSGCHCGMQVTVQKYSNGAEGSAFLTSARGSELSTSITQQNWTATPTSTSFSIGDRIVVKWWIKDAGGTMNSSKTVTVDYDGATAGSNGDTWVQFSESLQFQFEPEIIQNKHANISSQSSVTVPLNSAQAGNTLAVVIGAASPSTGIISVTDNGTGGGCLYEEANNALTYVQTSGGMTDIWYCPNSIAGTTSVTITVSPAPQGALTAWVYEVYGLGRNIPLDVSGSRNDTTNKKSSIHSGVVLTPSIANDFMLEAYAGPSGNLTAVTSPWTLDAAPATNGAVYLTDVATTSLLPTFTDSQTGDAVMSGAAFLEHQPPIVDAGPNQTIYLPTNSAMLEGGVTDDDLPNITVSVGWSKVSGTGTVTFNNANSESTQSTFSTSGTYVLQFTANDGLLSGSATTTITVNPEPISLVISPAIAGPDVTGTSQTVTGVLKVANTGAPIIGASVQFAVTGANATSGNATTDATGTATFAYTGTHNGNDTVQATYTGQNSNIASVGWVTPVQTVSTTTVLGRFYPNPTNSCPFNISPTATPVFTQEFPTINFNPPAGSIPGNTTGVGENTRPFTDITTDINGNFTGAIVAQGNGYQAGVGNTNYQTGLYGFQTVFTSSLTVSRAGNANIVFWDDDGIIFGVGGGATFVSGPSKSGTNPGPTTPFEGLPVLYYYNQVTEGGPQGFNLTVNFPAPGTYPFELDYAECDGGQLAMTMAVGSSGAPPTGNLVITPTTPASINVGQPETLTVQATDASGAAVPNVGVSLAIDGANLQSLSGTTNSSGQATFSYIGNYAGTDSVQAVADISGMATLSNVVTVPWNVGSGGGGGTPYIFTPQGWIASPTTGAILHNQVPITLASGVTLTSGTLKFFPSSNPNQITVLNSNATGTGPVTLGTFDPTLLSNGEYTIQLQATQSNGTSQLSEIVVSVTGSYKPGREKVTVTDFKVPLAGIPINITRTYDSLNRAAVGDFGNGWILSTNVQLSVDPLMNVTFTWNGEAQTFYFTPQSSGSALFAWLIVPAYTPQPGLHGSLTSNGCSALVQVGGAIVQDSLGMACFPAGSYSPTAYTYTDPIGRVYQITLVNGAWQLQSMKDLNGNIITIAPTGITGSVGGVVVPFVRDNQNRITKITDLDGNAYVYTYDSPCNAGNLCSVSFPSLTSPAQYTYLTDHSLATQVDPNGNTITTTYYSSVNDGGNASLDGRLQSLSDAMQPPNVWQYSYNLTTNTTTTTNPDGGTVAHTDDAFGKPLSITEQVNANTFRTTTYQYDGNENLVSMTDACGNGTCADTSGTNHTYTYTYDANGFQTSVQDPLGNKSAKVYNQYGGVTSATDAANMNTVTTIYDSNFNPIQTTDLESGSPGTLVNSSTYDALGDLLTFTDANQKTTELAYDPQGNLLQITDALNETTNYSYDAMGRVLRQTDPRRNTTYFAYDALGRLISKTDPLRNQTKYAYDNNGNKTSETDARDNTTSYHYDNMNRVDKITYPDTTTKQYTYDYRGNKLTDVDQSGRTTKYVYDLAGELASVTYAYGTSDAGTMSYAYDLDGRRQSVTDELNNSTNNNYDAAGRLISVQDALTHVTNYGYDADNRKSSAQDPNGNTTSYFYYPRGWLKAITYPIVSPNPVTTTQYTYDGMGRVQTITDQAGQITTNGYDAVGRLKSVQDAVQNLTQYSYDLNGNLASILDANNHTTSYQYDSLNRRVVRTLPLLQFETMSYDPVGNLSTKKDFNGKTTTYTYDTLNRLLKRIPDSSLNQTTINFTYNPTGTRATMSDASGTTSYTSYDNRDRLKTKATPEGTLNYTYDVHGNLLTIASSNLNGASLTYTYDPLNRLGSVTDNRIRAQGGPSNPITYGYDPAGNLSGYLYPNAVQTGNLFDTQNRLTQTCQATSSPACSASQKLASYAYTLGAAANRTAVAELNGRNVSYGYDNDYRLLSETITSDPVGNNGAEGYTYDGVGNRKTLSSTIPSLSGSAMYSYDANDRLTTDSYDANGNTTSSAGISNTYDFENRMLTHGSVSLVYDGDGNRVSETVGGTTTKYLVDALNPTGYSQVLDEIVSGAVTRTYAYGLQRISEDQLVSGSWVPSFYGYDGHGNARFLANAAGTVTDTYTFDAFGAPIASTGTTPNPYQYSGERFDSTLNLYHLRARNYNPLTGRFETMDPVAGNVLDPATLHKYVYTKNNPVNWIDPRGNAAVEEYDTVTFSRVENGMTHGFYNHFQCSLLGEEAIIAAITQAVLQVAASGADIGGTFEGMVEVDFQQIVYRAFPRAGTGCINVSTFFPPFSK